MYVSAGANRWYLRSIPACTTDTVTLPQVSNAMSCYAMRLLLCALVHKMTFLALQYV